MSENSSSNTRAKAVILLSGGLDSATCLAIAASEGYDCYCLSVDYGQRHSAELDAARRIAERQSAACHKVVQMDLRAIGGSALTDDTISVPVEETDGIPSTYVPARNTIMLSLAMGWAEVLGAGAIYAGVNAVDYSGYPDCRPEFIAAFQQLANLATKTAVEGQHISIETPLITMTKAEIISTGCRLGVDYSLTVSCYQADSRGRACGVCDSCRIRKQGFGDALMADPTAYF
ncbi:MAG: 7-cyano-7-deazaguanine synthase QueC [Proteobacteria bacterium]|nr:7-cyano-7-deazaguanine synthase QueC [Pseudomonadota bacterium]